MLPPINSMMPGFKDQLVKESGVKEVVKNVAEKGKELIQKAKTGFRDAGIKTHLAMQGDEPHKKVLRTAAEIAQKAMQT
jgi:hypothetical protein